MDRDKIRQRAREFSEDWAAATSEQSDKQSFWNEFYAIFGLQRKHVAAYEFAAKKVDSGGDGWIDLLHPGHMGVEHKSRGKDLDEAMKQLHNYLPTLPAADMPWLLLACDFERVVWHDTQLGTSGEFAVADLVDHLDLFWWLSDGPTPMEAGLPEVDVNLHATQLLADLHDELVAAGYPDHDLRQWLTRILFCLFADDAEVWERKLFELFVDTRTAEDGSDLGPQIDFVFQILDQPHDQRSPKLDDLLAGFVHINGDLFANRLSTPVCTPEVRDALRRACRYNWSLVSPAIFGSLFQNVMQPAERRELGAHYTTEANILRTIRPLFLDDLEDELERATSRPKLLAFHDKLARLRFFDPACGCGNFLVIAYRELRRLETETLRRLQTAGRAGQQQTPGQRAASLALLCRVTVDQFYGIEIEEFPALIARTALYLADHLANREVSAEFGEHFVRFPIPVSPHIAHDNAMTADWDAVLPAGQVSYVFGNPPFVGISLRSDQQTNELRQVWGSAYHGTLDYVTGWYLRTADYLNGRPDVPFAFVSTNSITQGEQVAAFWGPLRERGLRIAFAHRTFAWTSEAHGKAHVHVVIIGIDSDTDRRPELYVYDDITEDAAHILTPPTISAYLLPTDDVLISPRNTPLCASLPEVRYGNKPTDNGHLVVTKDEVDTVRADPIAAKYLRRYPGAKELIHNLDRWCLWLVDVTPADLQQSQLLRDRVAAVRTFREASKASSTRQAANTPTLFRQITQPGGRFLCIPIHVSERRRFFPVQAFDAEVVASNATFIADDPDGIAFAILSSSMFMAWFRMAGGRIKSDLRFNKLLVYNTFPAPTLTPKQRAGLTAAGDRVRQARSQYPTASLAQLYNPDLTPPALTKAHEQLDRVVDRIVAGRKRPQTEADRQTLLLDHYSQRVESGTTEPLFTA